VAVIAEELDSRSRANRGCPRIVIAKIAGAQAVAWVIVKSSDFEWQTGTPHRYKTNTGAFRTFCDSCGTSLTYETERRPDEIDITAGSLDHPENFPPTKDAYPDEKLPWVGLIS
jgi:hypothetical protein